MKELSIEEKAKAYDEAIERAKDFMNDRVHYTLRKGENIMCWIFPELRESEDERLRKEIIDFATKANNGVTSILANNYNFNKWIAWLEKQGEKPVNRLKITAGNWYVCDMEVWNENMITAFHRGEVYYCPKDGYIDVNGMLFEVGDLDVFRLATKEEIPQQKQEWSEEDDRMLDKCIKAACSNYYPGISSVRDWLKSLKERYTWKPNELDILLLERIANGKSNPQDYQASLYDLIGQLKKLSEE